MTTPISPERIAIYRRTARERQAHDASVMHSRRALAWAIARAAAQILKERFGAKRVIVFGSLVHSAWFHEGSDIDLAVEDIPSGKFFRAWATLDYLNSPFEIDLIDYTFAPAHLRQVIEQEGVEL